jgi:Domain of unknown function (DUF4268)
MWRAIEPIIEGLLPARGVGESPVQLLQYIATGHYAIRDATWTQNDDGTLGISFQYPKITHMPDELLFTVRGSEAIRAQPLTLAEAGLKERRDLQEWVIEHPEILGSDLMIVTMEFNQWQSSYGKTADRLDILGLHKSGELVVAELKRDEAPDTVEMQAIKYGAMVSRFTVETLAEQHAKFLSQRGTPTDEDAAGDLLAAFADITSETLRRPRLVLLASGYPPTTAATAVWLREMGIDITLMQYRAYKTGQEIAISVSQLYPVPAVEDFTISPRQAEVRAVEEKVRRRQDVSTVSKLIAAKLLADGTTLTLRLYGVNAELRDQIEAWLSLNPQRRYAVWTNHEAAPLRWAADSGEYTPTSLARLVFREATGLDRSIRGTDWWVDSDDHSLVELAAAIDGERGPAYVRFWTRLAEALRERALDWSPSPPSSTSWLNFKARTPGAWWELSFGHRQLIRSGLYFGDNRPGFDRLFARREEIEHRFGELLIWEAAPGKKFARVALHGSGDVTDAGDLERLIDWFIDTQQRLRQAIDGVVAVS